MRAIAAGHALQARTREQGRVYRARQVAWQVEQQLAVNGIGGWFFRAADPEGLAAWYLRVLGVGGKYGQWQQAAGPTVFMPFKADTDYWPAEKQWMLNLRVDDMDATLAALAVAGIAVKLDPAWDTPETGRFARIFDPEGNQLELWEPPAE